MLPSEAPETRMLQPVDLEGVERILVVMAHPDDVDFSIAGSVAAWTDAGIVVTYCIVTDGDAGGAELGIPRSEMAGIRRDEQRAAAEAVGVSDVRFLGYPDGRVELTLALRRDLSRVIRQVRPQRVIGMSPERNLDRVYATHPDHVATGGATLDAVYPDARNRWAHPELADEGLEPHTVDELWLAGGVPDPGHYSDITDVFPRKVEALCSHKSQVADPAAYETLLREWATANASAAGLPEGRLVELVRVINTR
jgi:LmbE family N-acetylglucosaminyl deacetylase